MKTKQVFLISILCFISALSIGHAQRNKNIKGNGNVVERTVSVAEYDAVQVVGSMDVALVRGTEGSVMVWAEENLQDYIVVESKNGQLTIKVENGVSISTRKNIKVTVPFIDLESVTLTGSGNVVGSDVISGSQFETVLTGSGDIVLALDVQSVDAKVTGSGDMTLSGRTDLLEVKLSGSGDFEGDSLQAEDAQAYVSGSGNAQIHAKNNLKARVNGSGDIRFKGSPTQQDAKVMGSGSIKSM
jgi:hypothetical protein